MKKETAEELCLAMSNITMQSNQIKVDKGNRPQDFFFTPVEVSPNLWGIIVAGDKEKDTPMISVEELLRTILYFS